MSKNLSITLLEGWADYSHENPDGPPTFIRTRSKESGALQVSVAEYQVGVIPNPSESDLEAFAADKGSKLEFGTLTGTTSGSCRFGKYGSAIFQSEEYARIQFWLLSNGRDFIMVTHIGVRDQDEIAEAQQIVMNMTLHAKPWWRIW